MNACFTFHTSLFLTYYITSMKHRRFFHFLLLLLTCNSAFSQDTPQRSAEAEALLQCFREIYGEKIISGATANVNWNINEAKWVYQHTGKWPALNFFDYIHLPFSAPGSWIDYSVVTEVLNWHRRGGIVGCMWHWNMPTNDGKDWTCTPGTASGQTSFDVKKIFEPESAEYKQMMQDIDKVAAYLKLLKNRKIPVLWRPLHEAGGMWFWWGMDAEACNELWRVMYRRFQEKGLDNLIWVWTSAAMWNKPYSDGYRWYPGDEYVDIVGIDIYNNSTPANIYTSCFKMLKQHSPDKLIALTECGNLATISKQWKTGSKWLYFSTWYDYERTNKPGSEAFKSTEHTHADAAWWTDAFEQDYVLTRDDFKALMTSVQAVQQADQQFLRMENGEIMARGEGTLCIYDLSGHLLRHFQLTGSIQAFTLAGMPRGVYIIRNGNRTLKVRH